MSACPISILDAIADPPLFGPWFTPESTWPRWTVFEKALFGLSMSLQELEIFREHTGRQAAPTGPAREAWVIVGRRGGKSLIAAVYAATFRDYRPYLKPGERAVVMVVAADPEQA